MAPLLLALLVDCSHWGGNGAGVYNLSNALSEQYATAIDQAGPGALRFGFRIDTQQTWNDALYAQYDALVEKAREHGIDLLAIVLYESTTLGQTDWNNDPGGTGMNAYVQTFVDTIKPLMARYGDTIKHWEIWNEPNCWSNSNYANDPQHAGCYYILPRVYSKLLAETFVQAHDVITQKNLHLVTGGLFAHDIGGGFSPATDYMTEVYQQGPWDWMQQHYGRRYPWDAFGYHIYIDQGGATNAAHIRQYLDAIAQLRQQYGDATPIWMTEFGWPSSDVGEAGQASNLDIALGVFESRSDIERTFFFKVDDYAHFGIYRGDWSAKPAVGVLQSHTASCVRAPRLPDAGATDAGFLPDAAGTGGAGGSSGAGGGAGGAGGGPGANGNADVGAGCGCSVGARLERGDESPRPAEQSSSGPHPPLAPSGTLLLLWLTIVYHGRSFRPWRTTRTSKRL
jgi:hypothetical protein